MELDKQDELLAKALRFIPMATQTLSKGYNYFPRGASPLFLERGSGAHVWDVDENEFVDCIMGLCTVLLGYNYPRVNEMMMKQILKGVNFSQPSQLEAEVAMNICDTLPGVEMLRFCKTGSEACQAAVRTARSYTGRQHVASYGYHGWHSEFAVTTERPGGCPMVLKEYIHEFKYNDLDSLQAIFDEYPDQIACIIMEPVINVVPANNWLGKVRDLCHKYGALLIFDEVVTAFRWCLGGASQFYDVTPDIMCIGKSLANGMPIAAVGGRYDIIKEFENIFFSGTFGGECVSLAAALACLKEYKHKDVMYSQRIWESGRQLMSKMQQIPGLKVYGFPCRPFYKLDCPDPVLPGWESPETITLLMKEVISRGVLGHYGYINVSLSHTPADIDRIANAIGEATLVVAEAYTNGTVKQRLEGVDLIQPSFKRN